MKISTEIDSIAKLVGEEKAIELVAKAGFDAFDFSMFSMVQSNYATRTVSPTTHPLSSTEYASYVKKLKQIGLDNGIVCNQSHAPFPSYCEGMIDYLKRAIECTAIAGGEICIIHPDNYKSAEQNAEMYFELLPLAKEYNVKIATENMWNWDREAGQALPAACSHHDDFAAHIKAVNDPYFVACLDIGHAEMKGLDTDSESMIHALGDSLQALHIHDNDMWHDSHQIPFSMQIDFEKMVKALKDIGYKGYFTLEAVSYLNSEGYTADNAFEGIKKMADAARKLADMFEAL